MSEVADAGSVTPAHSCSASDGLLPVA